MGRIQDFFGKLLKRENTPLALTDGNKAPEATFSEKQESFKGKLSVTVNDKNISETKAQEDEVIEYNAQNFKKHPEWREWYTNTEIRNQYYDSRKYKKNEHSEHYQGALTILAGEEALKKILCTCIDDERKAHKLELGKAKRKLLLCSNARD